MVHVIARLIGLSTVAIGSAWLIARFRVVGVIISILAGWAILFAVYRGFAVPSGEWDEDGEEIAFTAPFLMMMWSFFVWGMMNLLGIRERRGNRNGEANTQ